MIAPLAKEDFEELQRQGLNPSLEDFDRLNSLALRLQRGDETTPANAPRIGWAGDVPFFQPTFQAFDWFLSFADHAPDAATKDLLWFFALAHARVPHFFDALTDPATILAKAEDWLGSLPCTPAEIVRAARYAACGFDDADPGRNPNGNEAAPKSTIDSIHERITRTAAALHSAPADLATLTIAQLDALYEKHEKLGGATFKKSHRLYDDYKFALREIRERLTKEKSAENGEKDAHDDNNNAGQKKAIGGGGAA